MQSLDSITAIENEGLEGDRYQTKKGYWDPVEGCQVTFITLHEISKANKKAPMTLDLGQHRRNLVIADIYPRELMNKMFQIGEAVFQYEKPRPPCGYLDQLVIKGTAKSLNKHSGFCARVLKTGLIKVGDELTFLT